MTGGVQVSTIQPFTILTGTVLTFNYTPEAEAEVKRALQTLTFTATSDITFVPNGSCFRPVGSFLVRHDDGAATQTWTTTAAATGYSRSDDPVFHVWGKRCIER